MDRLEKQNLISSYISPKFPTFNFGPKKGPPTKGRGLRSPFSLSGNLPRFRKFDNSGLKRFLSL